MHGAPEHVAKALVENERIDAVFKFFRPSPVGDGTTQRFFELELESGRLASQSLVVPDTIVPATSTEPRSRPIHGISARPEATRRIPLRWRLVEVMPPP